MNPSSFGLIPSKWKIESLGDGSMSKIIGSGIEEFEGSKYYVATVNVIDSELSNDLTEITMDDKTSRANMQPVPKSVWFAKMKDSRKYNNGG
ncbi:MAG: hypothetical protein LBR15_04690 [Methanobrevibacter sp.]|jgi:type I restriction enzyme S subunit|nr:hypothetical protein [Candidatus Methanovirga australis]